MSRRLKHLYDFGPYRIDAAKRLLLKDGEPVSITPKAFDTLLALVQGGGEVLEKEELIRRIWPDSFVEEGNLTVNISQLRKALGESPNQHLYIVTVPGRGYRFVADVREILDQDTELVVEEHTRSRIVIEEDKLPDSTESFGEGKPLTASLAATVKSRRWKMRPRTWFILLSGIALVTLVYFLFLPRRDSQSAQPTRLARQTIAVLPFTVINPRADNEHLALGIADILITKLSHIQQLVIRPTGSVGKYNNSEQDPVAAGRELKVEKILQGSVYQQGEKIRITLKLVNVEDGSYLWAYKFDEDLNNIFAIQDSISEQVARALEVKLSNAETIFLTKHYTNNPEAYQLYMKGRHFWEKRTGNNLEKSLKCFEAAVNKDPEYALAYAGLADVYTLMVSGGGNYALPLKDAISKARAAVMKAIELDENLSDAHTSLGIIHLSYDWDWVSAEREFKRALELSSNSYSAHYWYSLYLSAMDRREEAISEAKLAEEIAPTSVRAIVQVARAFNYAHKYDQALIESGRALEMEPNHPTAHNVRGMSYLGLKQYEAAIAEFEKAAVEYSRISGTANDPSARAWLGVAYALSGQSAEAMAILNELEQVSQRVYVSPYRFIGLYSSLGNKDKAFEWVEKAYQERGSYLAYAKVDDAFFGLRDDPRYVELLRRLALTS